MDASTAASFAPSRPGSDLTRVGCVKTTVSVGEADEA
jgi:hypothetical protein